jgi:hypothetical protein
MLDKLSLGLNFPILLIIPWQFSQRLQYSSDVNSDEGDWWQLILSQGQLGKDSYAGMEVDE